MSLRQAQAQPVVHGKQGVWQCAQSPYTAISPITDFSATGIDVFSMFTFDINSPADGYELCPSSDIDDIPLEDLFTNATSYPDTGNNSSVFAPLSGTSFDDWTEPQHDMNNAAFLNEVIDANLAADMSQWGWENTQLFPQELEIPSPELYNTFYPTPSPTTATSSPNTSYLSPAPSPPSTSKPAGPFACPDDSCPKSFTTQNLLRKHKRKHTKPFVCSVCTKGHAAKKDLHRHMWVRHPEAAEEAGLPSELRRCTARGCTFEGRQDNLTRHIRTKHRNG